MWRKRSHSRGEKRWAELPAARRHAVLALLLLVLLLLIGGTMSVSQSTATNEPPWPAQYAMTQTGATNEPPWPAPPAARLALEPRR